MTLVAACVGACVFIFGGVISLLMTGTVCRHMLATAHHAHAQTHT